jgi:DNA-directed RNA polymerase subunit RPC12/RpoP
MDVICVACEQRLRPVKNGVVVAKMADYGPFELVEADELECPGCGFRVISGFAQRSFAYLSVDAGEFNRLLELSKENRLVRYWY